MADTDTAQEGNNGLLKKALGGLDLGGFDPDAYGSLIQEESKAKGDVARAEQEQKRIAAQGKATAEKTFATGLKQKYAAAEPTLMSAPSKFNVTKDTQEGLTGLAALMTVGSLIIGSKGAMSGTNAMNAMTGVLKGYQEGNQQRIDFETKKYEQSIKDWERTLQQTKESLSRYEKLAATDLSAATAQAAAEAASKGQEVIAAKIRQEGLTQTKAMVDKLITQTIDNKAKMDRVVPKTERPIIAQDEEGKPIYVSPSTGEPMLGSDGSPLRPAPTGRAAAERPLMPSAAERKSYVGLGNTITTAEKLSAKLDDPVFVEKIRKYRWNNLFAEEGGKIASQLLQSKIPDDVREFIQLGNALRNAYYLDTSGKAVTGLEAMRNYNVVPQPGDAPEVLRSKFKILIDKFNDDLSDYREMYPRLPDLTRVRATARTVPGQQAPAVESESENKKAAREAIKRGAPRDAVLKRLQEAGEDISGL
jgi:hypothetical protein